MDQRINKTLTMTMLIAFSIFLISGIYNTFIVDFSVDTDSFNAYKFSIKNTKYKKIVSYASTRKRSLARANYSKKRKVIVKKATENSRQEISPVNQRAHIQDEIDLVLKEFFNPKLYKKVLSSNDAEGSLRAKDGIIESFEIALPNGEQVTGQFSEMNGNVFTYDHEGVMFSGLIYQSGNNAYSVSLVNGPLKGSKMKFVTAESLEKDYGRSLSNEKTYEELAKEDEKQEKDLELDPDPVDEGEYKEESEEAVVGQDQVFGTRPQA